VNDRPARHVPRYRQAAAIVRAQIEDGTLKPGSPAPSGAALARITGYSSLTCRKALTTLIREGTLCAGPSPNARPRVAGTDQADTDLSARAAALSGALIGRRRAAGHTQRELSDITGYSVTAIGHAETGRLWQSRAFWETIDRTLNAAGEMLRFHDDYSATLTHPTLSAAADATTCARTVPAPVAPVPARAPAAAPVIVTITWPDGTTTTVHQPLTSSIAQSETPSQRTPPAGGLHND
jgi:DNA-binding transcriptional regulator YhcF (GntR family)